MVPGNVEVGVTLGGAAAATVGVVFGAEMTGNVEAFVVIPGLVVDSYVAPDLEITAGAGRFACRFALTA